MVDVQARRDKPERSPERPKCYPYLPNREQSALFPHVETSGAGPRGPRRRYAYWNQNPSEEATIRKLTLGLVGAAAVAAGLLLMRQHKQTQPKEALAEAEDASGTIPLERMRELGL